MKKEYRILFLIVLTYCVYALSIFLDKGGFILPFPFNPAVFLLVAIQFTIWNIKKNKSIIILLLASILSFLSFGAYWSTVLNHKQLIHLNESITLDLFQVTYVISIIIYSFIFFKKKWMWFALLFALSLFTGYISDYQLFIPIAFLIASIGGFIQNKSNPNNSIWLILLFLESSVYFSILSIF